MIPPLPRNITTLVLQRTFAAARPRVFQAWIEPEALEHWFRPLGMCVTVRKLDAYVGGSFRFDVDNGSSIVGTYLHIVPPEKLVFTFSGGATQDRETLVTLDFLDQGLVTEVVLTHQRLDTPEMQTLFGNGWQLPLDTLAEFLSTRLADDALSS